MSRVLLLTNKIPHYRLPLYEMLGMHCQLTIAHTGTRAKGSSFSEILLTEKKIGPFFYFKGDLHKDKFDIIIIYLNIRLINLYTLLWGSTKAKCILYGIGVSASYTKRYDRNKLVAFFTKIVVKKADAAIFYDQYPVIKYSSKGVDPTKLFVAANTVVSGAQEILSANKRDIFLFIGSLYKQKGIGQLLEAYKMGIDEGVQLPNLSIIGDGPDATFVKQWIEMNNLQHKILLLGQITAEIELEKYLKRAICCISPNQAGLSVQKAFSYGVPFMTSYYPISGGEFTSIIDQVTGFLYDGTSIGLLRKMEEVVNHPFIDSINTNCWEYYNRFRSRDVWLLGFKQAIKYVS